MPCSLSTLLPTQGPFPPPALPGFPRYYEPLRHPASPASPSRGPGSARASPPTGLPMLPPSSPSMRASATTPAGPKRCPRRSLPPPSSAFPISQVGRPRIARFEACSTFTRVPAACSLNRPKRPFVTRCFRPYRCLHDPPWLLPTGATVVGRVSHPLEEGAFPWRTEKLAPEGSAPGYVLAFRSLRFETANLKMASRALSPSFN